MAIAASSTDSTLAIQRPSAVHRWLQHLTARPSGLLGLVIVVTFVLLAILAPVVAPHDPLQQNWKVRLEPPLTSGDDGQLYILGTDSLGRDILSRLIFGARISIAVAVLAVALRSSMGVLIGLAAGYYRGPTDAVLMRLADIQLAIPFLVLAIALMAIIGTGFSKIVLVLGVTGWVTYGRIVRSEVLSVRERDYVEAARAIGAPNRTILFRHVLPNVSSSIIVISTLEIALMITAEATLSFLGLGIQPPTPSWGVMVADGRDLIYGQWWVSAWPGLAICLAVLGVNLLGDWLRDVLDPTTRGGALQRRLSKRDA
ncbi:MAG: ABC transporter permease [Thermomicrobiales bacterium]|nr:ABC transporter permease [Thermomicrobiales bacterium]